ncbi:MAG: hypothetical protein QW299_07520 [Candidatus Caldarchaeum sp.]
MTGRKLEDDLYKRQPPTKKTVALTASTKTAGFGGLGPVPTRRRRKRRKLWSVMRPRAVNPNFISYLWKIS